MKIKYVTETIKRKSTTLTEIVYERQPNREVVLEFKTQQEWEKFCSKYPVQIAQFDWDTVAINVIN